MQTSEYIQIACAVVGIGLIAWARTSLQSRLQYDSSISSYSKAENIARLGGVIVIGLGLVLVFFPFG